MDEPIDISIEFDDGFDRQIRSHGELFDPVSKLVFRVDETWISGDDVYCEVRAVGFFTQLLTALSELAQGETERRIRLYGDTYLAFHRSGDELSVAHRYTEAAIDDPDERLGVESEVVTELTQVGLAAIDGAEQVKERVLTVVDDSDQAKLHRLDSAIDTAQRQFERS